MNNNYSTMRRLNENIRARILIDKFIDGESQNSSSDSEFSDGYDCCLDDDLNAIVKQARMKKKIKKERLSAVDLSSERMERDVQFEDWEAVKKLEADDSQQKTTENTEESNITVIENETNAEVTTNEINPGLAPTNISSGNVVDDDHHINDETIIIAANPLDASGIPDETLGFFYDPEGNEWITINATQLSEFAEASLVDTATETALEASLLDTTSETGAETSLVDTTSETGAETSLVDTTTETALETSRMDTTSDAFSSTAGPPTTPIASDDSHWVTDYDSDDVTDNFNRNN